MDDEKAEKLIILVAEYVELYDLMNKNYSNQQRKENIWRDISLKLNETPERCKTKRKNLRDGFQRAVKNTKTKSGQAAKSTRKWHFYESMSFLLLYLKNRDTHSNIDEVHTKQRETECNESEQYNDDGNESISEEVHSPFTDDTQPSTPLSTVPSVHSSECSEKIESRAVQNKRNILKNQKEPEPMPKLFREFLEEKKTKRIERAAKSEETDPLEQFFICMSRTVKTFPPFWQSQVKSKVFETVNSTALMLLSGNNSALLSNPSTGFTHPQNTASSQYISPSTLQPNFYDIPSAQTSTDYSTKMQSTHTSTADSILNSSSSETSTYKTNCNKE